ncbi:MAG TPA: flagellar biosynthetic protein FliR [Candidatus Hydrogenedentes bacterium]|nr:flagellar biosynthetic protein FliR [Candidatus Hydrogenedentota bacterium]
MLFEAEVFKVFVLVMIRISGLMVSAPVLGSANFPARAKIGLAVLIAFLVTPTIAQLHEPLGDDYLTLGLAATFELAIGLLMGFFMTLVFAAVQVAGQMIDMLSGFSLMNVFNPALETQVPIFGFFLYIVAALYLLAIDGHLLMIRAIVRTFETMPLGEATMRPEVLGQLSRWGSLMFVDGLLIAAPVGGALLLAYVTMGLMGRVVPQIHLFVVGFPFTIALALLITALFIGVYIELLDRMFHQMFQGVSMLVRGVT